MKLSLGSSSLGVDQIHLIGSRWVLDSTIGLTTVCIVILWFGWYIWRFYLVPFLYPNEPRLLRYWIPFVGHAVAFVRGAENVYKLADKLFRDTEPYTITLMGNTTVIIRDIKDMALVWKSTTALSYDPFTSRMLTAFGISPHNVPRLYQPGPASLIADEKTREKSLLYHSNPKSLSYMHLQSHWFKVQFLPGEQLNSFMKDFPGFLAQFLEVPQLRKGLTAPAVSSTPGQPSTVVVPLGRFCRYVLAQSALRAFFGEQLFEVEPEFGTIYQRWEDASWKVFFNFPHLLAPQLHKDRKRVIESLATYLDIPDSKRDTAWLFRAINDELGNLGLPVSDRAGITMMMCWAVNNNTHYVAFWMLSHILCNSSLKATIENEINSCFPSQTSDDGYDMERMMNECPHLNALWYEVLRVYNASTAVRKATRDCSVGNTTVHEGDQVFGPVRNFHLNGGVFGTDADQFDHTRFLEDPKLRKAKEYCPFGGGHTLCPGRSLAEREIYLLIAFSLRRFQMVVTTSDGHPIEKPQVPAIRRDLPVLAATAPIGDLFVGLETR